MKYIITESQINKVVFAFLNGESLHVIKQEDNYYFFDSKNSWDNGDSSIISYFNRSKNCFIGEELIRSISFFFCLSISNSIEIISKWVENKLGVDISYFYSDIGAS